MENTDNKMQCFEDLCRKSGLKLTPQRQTVYKALINTHQHPTAEEIYREVKKDIPNISLDTVNRTLLTFAHIGVAFVVEGTGQPRRFDGDLENHQHFLCVRCGKIVDFKSDAYDNIVLPEEFESGYEILRKTVYLEGICPCCVNSSESKEIFN